VWFYFSSETIMPTSVLNTLWDSAQQQQFPTHTLYIVATPIGNLADISVRALAILARVDAIACEDTRHSKTLLNQYGIQKPLIATHEHNENESAQQLIARLQKGERIALITDAGTPAISDPGARVVNAVRAAGLRVIPIAGASAVVTALSATGVDGAFAFLGFLPNKAGARTQVLDQWKNTPAHLVFYEAPHRLHDTIRALANLFPEREMTVAREVTKLYEAFQTFALSNTENWIREGDAPRGEYVLILHAATSENAETAQQHWQTILEKLLPHLALKQAVTITVELTSAPKNEVYAYALELKNQT
jgi:16S rRNA (cytidine1402-2'-O)-methyltransferase